ncbi:MAG: ABC transporter permease [Anaerolineae bacterium]|jgi:ABC-2 type transport system permease protein
MKAIDICLKDLRRNLTNAFFLVFGLGLPLLTSLLFYFAFGGLVSGGEEFDLPTVQVQVANLDQGVAGFSAGQLIVDTLRTAIPDLLQVSGADDATSARAAVDHQQAAVAVIVPAGFSEAAFASDERATVELYQDPTLTLGPGIVKDIVSQMIDAFAGSRIAVTAARQQLRAAGADAGPAALQEIATQYAAWSSQLGGQEAVPALFEIQAPPTSDDDSAGGMSAMLGLIMAGMMVFYVFFTGAASAQSIIQEEEAGTLARLFTTPTPQSAILGGKFISIFLLLIVQVIALVLVSAWIFNIPWGDPLPVALVILGLVVMAASFGIFITSFLKNSRQAGIIYGGVMTVMGMIGMVGVFTASVPGADNPMRTASLFVPQGWGVRGWQLLLEGSGALTNDVLLTVGVMLALGLIFFVIGLLKFRNRFA